MDNEVQNRPGMQTQQAPSPVPQSGISNGNKRLLTTILVILILFILFFGLLSISHLLPKQSQQYTNTTSVPTASPSSIKPEKQMLAESLSTILKPVVIPQSSSISVIQEDFNFRSIASWKTPDGTASASFVVDRDSLKIYQLQIYLPFNNSEVASIGIAQQTIPQFLTIKPKGIWGCKTLSNGAGYCENFWQEENGVKRGVGLAGIVPHNPKAKTSFISFCELSRQSRIYSRKSCNAEFAKTGILTKD